MKGKNGIIITNAFQKVLDTSRREPSKIWIDKGSVLYNRSMKSSLQGNDVEVYSTHNEKKSVAVARFIRTLKNKIYKYMTSILQNVCTDKLDDIVTEYNNKCHRTI